ncbi:unnamed protein product [Fusarium graminearum]|uniref:Chromosome 1, complete genome n=2 Tax=Gibberella zeae TaxID=5518 RepID=I1RZU8_GIBZE|nr:hypothetical protein FGSG_09953 [Fusarium graminearum PH-1]EYB26953.1 hypothetical protein FG05_09953 [Fusarium graminearum]ESU16600.1 hypothetical protein FGSG_09953 [Fusarium graminearum PH-1]KAI6749159.1 hypothetical protein HG531_008106 [Fusarium graminearum]PCD31571.1 hypothetical protein FGRA07_10114 [Fusarium graminearum]CAF3445690.1 unnamed protein product [Fusarium graminearum]|eukprot:XP_011318862.1 hypothetical protein FGSG_09953 [Fusarium graminearum PH-1]
MSNANLTQSSGKRSPDTNLSGNSQPIKRTRSDDVQIQTFALGAPHESIIAELKPKYDVLPASVISSTQIKKRVTHVANHLLAQGDRRQIALLYARTADVCKLITVVEKCKQVLSEEGKQHYQYNQLFDQPEKPRRKDIVEETILEKGTMDEEGDGSGSDDFEVMHSRFEDAVLPRPSQRIIKSMRVFLSIIPIPELKLKKGVTVQSGTAR